MLAFLNGQNYQVKPTDKSFKCYLQLLTMEIKKCKLNIIKKKNEGNGDNAYSSFVNKTGFEDKYNYENNFYSIIMKENFDNFLIDDNNNLENE